MQEPMMYASKFIVSNATEFVIEGESIDNVNK
jgi:hypothetical protein